MVYSALIRRRGRNGKYVPLLTNKMVVPMPIEPSFDIIVAQIKPHTIARLENKLVRIAPQIVIENDDSLAGRLAVQIILDPTEHFLSFESRRMVSAQHRSHDIVHRTHIKRVITWSIDAFEEFLTIFSFHQVVVAQTIKHRTAHVGRVHQPDMCLQAILIADVSRMYDESRPFVGCAIP